MNQRFVKFGSFEEMVISGIEEEEEAAAGADVLLLESDTGGTDNLLLETGDNLLLEG